MQLKVVKTIRDEWKNISDSNDNDEGGFRQVDEPVVGNDNEEADVIGDQDVKQLD